MLLTGIPKISFKDNRAFAVVDSQGESPRIYSSASELGFYFNDTRFLGVWEMTFNGMAPVSLAKELRFGGNTVVLSMTNRDFERIGQEGRIPRDTFLIRRILTFWKDTLFETVEIKNFSNEKHLLQVEQWAGGRFDDVFEVRGFPRERRGRMLPTHESNPSEGSPWRSSVLQYEGLDGQTRRTFIQRLFGAEKIRVSPSLVGYFSQIEVGAKSTVLLKTIVSFDKEVGTDFWGQPFENLNVADMMNLLNRGTDAASHFAPLKIESDNAILNRAIQNAFTDVFMLLTEEPSGDLYPYAGIPWFSAPFGRDGLITAYQMLPWCPKLAKGVINYAFSLLGSKYDPFTDEEPGKVFHEMRRGEMARTREVPFIPYYGSVDSTPLSLILLHEYVRWTMDLESLRKWWPDALRALEWIRHGKSVSPDGFLEYAKQSPTGLVNQGWKDSHDSVMHANGQLATSPIRLCEVQAYSFRARMGMSALAGLMGDNELSGTLRQEAFQLRARFNERFWNSRRGFVNLALDGAGEPCEVLSSNMGHCLWGEVLSSHQARQVASHLLSDSLFSGHGVRTLADSELAFNPLSYHNGSVWPHDNSLIMEGLRNYHLTDELERMTLGLLGVLEASEDFRLPELFCGFRRRDNAAPVPYEVACKPQAWAAGSIFLMLKSMLGMTMDTDQNYLVFNSPLLTNKLNWLEIKNLQGRDWDMDLMLRRSTVGTMVDITRRQGSVRVLTVK